MEGNHLLHLLHCKTSIHIFGNGVDLFGLGDRTTYLTPREEYLTDIQAEPHASPYDSNVFDAVEMVACQLRVLKLETGRCVINVDGEYEFSPGDQE